MSWSIARSRRERGAKYRELLFTTPYRKAGFSRVPEPRDVAAGLLESAREEAATTRLIALHREQRLSTPGPEPPALPSPAPSSRRAGAVDVGRSYAGRGWGWLPAPVLGCAHTARPPR